MGITNISVLARATQERTNRQTYGKLRCKLQKNGFSEIMLYKVVMDHCEENDIDPKNMAEDMYALLEGCASNLYFIKVDDRFPYLRGMAMFHQLRYGNLEKDEVKCPEQRGKFICNRCYIVKDGGDRCKRKVDKNSCQCCADENARQTQMRYMERKRKQQAELKETGKALVSEPVNKVPTPLMTPEAAVEVVESVKANQSKELVVNQVETESTFEPVEVAEAKVAIVEVIADAEEANVAIKCKTVELPNVLMALNRI